MSFIFFVFNNFSKLYYYLVHKYIKELLMLPIDYFRNAFINCFKDHYVLNDPAHRIDHFEWVYQNGLEIKDRLGLDYPDLAILGFAYLHDLFAWSRNNHHTLSSQWLASTDYPLIEELIKAITKEYSKWCTVKARVELANACLEHRASYKGRFTSDFTKFCNAADLGKPSSVESLVKRAFQYNRAITDSKVCDDLVMKDAIEHVKCKYGRHGYALISDMYRKAFREELEELYIEIYKWQSKEL